MILAVRNGKIVELETKGRDYIDVLIEITEDNSYTDWAIIATKDIGDQRDPETISYIYKRKKHSGFGFDDRS